MERTIIPVLMCGGAGTRLWPVSRESMPKQFVPLVGQQSTFQRVLDLVTDATLFARPIVITNAEFRFLAAEQLRERAVEADIVLEPSRRDSGPAVAVAALLGAQRDPEAIVLVLAADNIIQKHNEFFQCCRDAATTAAEGYIVTFGIRPAHPATNYGYIRPGRKLNGAAALAVDAFVEKPNAATAASYVADKYLWNSGNFMFRAHVMLGEIERFEPAMAASAKRAVAEITRDLDFLRLDEKAFALATKKSIDYAVMEQTSLAAVVPGDFGWSDVGNWNAVWDISSRDTDGNVTEGPVVTMDSRNILVRSDDSVLTTVIGINDIVVVSSGDAVLVAARNKAEDVKALVEQLKTQNRREAVEHRRSYRPWGYYQSVDLGTRFQVKRIVVKPGAKLSLQKHFHRAEHWVVVSGTAEVTVNGDVRAIHENESIYVPIGATHRLANPGKIALELIEVQVGSYLGEDDIVRIEDVYARK